MATKKVSTRTKKAKARPKKIELDRLHMIAEAAYFHAEHRGFQGGDINEDWYRAEVEIDAMIAERYAN